MSSRAPRLTLPIFAVATILLSACGSDSTGPTDLDSAAALQSLALGLGDAEVGSPATTESFATIGALAPFLDKVTITVGGKAQNMYALGLRESFPAGTCEETLFVDPNFPPEPGVCTPPQLLVGTILWQTDAANQPPDKMLFVVGDVGENTFDFAGETIPALGVYLEGQNKFWLSQSGTLTSAVTSLNQTCDVPLPPYAKSGSCSFATFTENGSIVLEQVTPDGTAGPTVTITIPSITFHGMWLNVTEVQPTTLPIISVLPRSLRAPQSFRAPQPLRAGIIARTFFH